MASAVLVSAEEYLATHYRPDCDYVDGEIIERNRGEFSHATMQGAVLVWLHARKKLWRSKPVPELRLRITPRRFRIPDVVVIAADAPVEQVVVTPPLLCIEILSPSDTLSQIWERTQDYLSVGVPTCWIIDPLTLHAWTVTSAGLTEAKDGILRAGEIEMPLSEVTE
jgi:Uma2 family endonuclease